MLKLLSLIATLAFLALGVIVGMLNPTLVPFDYLFNQRHVPLSILLSVAFIFGMVFAGLFAFLQVVRLQWQLHRLNKSNKQQANELIELKKQLLKTSQPSQSTAINLR